MATKTALGKTRRIGSGPGLLALALALALVLVLVLAVGTGSAIVIKMKRPGANKARCQAWAGWIGTASVCIWGARSDPISPPPTSVRQVLRCRLQPKLFIPLGKALGSVFPKVFLGSLRILTHDQPTNLCSRTGVDPGLRAAKETPTRMTVDGMTASVHLCLWPVEKPRRESNRSVSSCLLHNLPSRWDEITRLPDQPSQLSSDQPRVGEL